MSLLIPNEKKTILCVSVVQSIQSPLQQKSAYPGGCTLLKDLHTTCIFLCLFCVHLYLFLHFFASHFLWVHCCVPPDQGRDMNPPLSVWFCALCCQGATIAKMRAAVPNAFILLPDDGCGFASDCVTIFGSPTDVWGPSFLSFLEAHLV